MNGELLANGKVTLHCGDCLEVMSSLPENSVDSVVTDPPYHLTSIVKRFGAADATPNKDYGKSGVYKRSAAGFMGKQWDGGDVAFRPETWAHAYRVLKPGGHIVAFSATRQYHRMACAIEDAGFEIRDMLSWLYGSGFPKSHNVSKGIDKKLGAEREIARQWNGWGTALKPALEPICFGRKPLIGTVVDNVLEFGTGAMNIDGCRIEDEKSQRGERSTAYGLFHSHRHHALGLMNDDGWQPKATLAADRLGRWPANVLHDGGSEVVGMFPDVGGSGEARELKRNAKPDRGDGYGMDKNANPPSGMSYPDSGSAARFFYTAKADGDDRLGSKHPTVKPLDLMQWLVRLVTPPGGTVLDCFAGTGTTGEAAFREGFKAILIEREAEYQNDIRRRMSLVLGGPDERRRESLKAAGKVEYAGPLFALLGEG